MILHDLSSLTPKQVAAMLGVGINTIRREIRLGHLDAYKIGHREYRISVRALSAYIAGKEQEARESRTWQ